VKEEEEERTQERGKTGFEKKEGPYREEVRGRAVKIYWPFERMWFRGIVDRFNSETGEHHVSYDDGDKLWYLLEDEERQKRLRWVDVPRDEKPGQRAKETPRNRPPERGTVAATGRPPSTEADKARERVRDQSDSDDTAGDLGGAGETGSEGRAATPVTFGTDSLSREKTKRRKRVREASGSDSDRASSTEGSSSRELGSGSSRRSSKGTRGGTASDWKRSRDVICLDDSDEDSEGLGEDGQSTGVGSYFGPEETVKRVTKPLAMSRLVLDRVRRIQQITIEKVKRDLHFLDPAARDPGQEKYFQHRVENFDNPHLTDLDREAGKSPRFHQVYAGAGDYANRVGKQQSVLMPFTGFGFYNSHGRFFTQPRVLAMVCEHLIKRALVCNDDHFIDFCAGANEFAPMLADKLADHNLARGKSGPRMTFQSFDIFPAKNRENFAKKNWFSVCSDDLSEEGLGKEVVMGLNPPFGKDNNESRKFLRHGIKHFEPRLLVLIVPELGSMDELGNYDEIHRDGKMCTGKDFYIPGAHAMGTKHHTDTQPNFIIYQRRTGRKKRQEPTGHAGSCHDSGPLPRDPRARGW